MDPGTRRFLWDFIDATRQNRAMVLTTHSMEEADALCSNIGELSSWPFANVSSRRAASDTLVLVGIMIKGALRTVGSSQQLKAQHGSGYRVAVRLRDGGEAASSGGSSSVDKLALAICKSANVEDAEKGFSLQRFEVPMAGAGAGPSDEGATLGHIFSTILEHQDALNIVDFSGALLCPCELVLISHTLLNVRCLRSLASHARGCVLGVRCEPVLATPRPSCTRCQCTLQVMHPLLDLVTIEQRRVHLAPKERRGDTEVIERAEQLAQPQPQQRQRDRDEQPVQRQLLRIGKARRQQRVHLAEINQHPQREEQRGGEPRRHNLLRDLALARVLPLAVLDRHRDLHAEDGDGHPTVGAQPRPGVVVVDSELVELSAGWDGEDDPEHRAAHDHPVARRHPERVLQEEYRELDGVEQADDEDQAREAAERRKDVPVVGGE